MNTQINSCSPDIVTSVTGQVFVAETPEQFICDDDGNMLTDGCFSYVWDAENRLLYFVEKILTDFGFYWQMKF